MPENTIRKLRRQVSLTQEEFAHELGITVATVNRWENLHARPSKLARMCILAYARERNACTPELEESMKCREGEDSHEHD